MAQCNRCGQSAPVLAQAKTPQAQEFLGSCKPCIMKELSSRNEEARRRAGEWIGGVIDRIFR